MHPLLNSHALVPALSTAAALMLAVVIAVRDHDHPARPQALLLLLFSGIWSFCDAGMALSSDAETALAFARCAGIGSMFIGPTAFQAMLRFEPRLAVKFERFVPWCYSVSAVAVALTVATRWVVVDVDLRQGSHDHWLPQFGPALPYIYSALVIVPLSAALQWLRLMQRDQSRRRNGPWIELAFLTPLLMGSLTDFLLPLLGVDVPRLGAACLIAWWGLLWWSILRRADADLSPRDFASEILEALPDGVILLRLDQRIRAANSAMGAMLGVPAAELLGRPISELLSRSEAVASGADQDIGWQLERESGERTPVSITRSNLHDDRLEPIGSVLVVRDLREVVSLRNRLLSSGRLAAIGQLAAGIAHEINNPIAYVRSNLSLLQQHWRQVHEDLAKTPGGPTLREMFEDGEELMCDAFDGVERVASIVRDVEGFSLPAGSEQDVSDLGGLLDSAVRMTRPALPEGASIERDYRGAPLVHCRSQELIQVFLNLLRNACQAIGPGGTVRVVIDRDETGPLVSIEDDGPGITPAALQQIFEPFFTTKPVGIGTGLGLAISKQIVERHGGRIEVESKPGRGTRFCIRLAMADCAPEEPGEGPENETGDEP